MSSSYRSLSSSTVFLKYPSSVLSVRPFISKCPLESDYNNLYAKWTGIDCKAEESNEILMSCQHTSSATGRFGNRTYSYFNPQFSNFSGGWTQRGQYIGGMDFQRCRPTEYAYAIFDNVNDSRMWKTFKTVYGLNNIASKADDVVATNGITADQVPTLGDQGIIFIINKKVTTVLKTLQTPIMEQ